MMEAVDGLAAERREAALKGWSVRMMFLTCAVPCLECPGLLC